MIEHITVNLLFIPVGALGICANILTVLAIARSRALQIKPFILVASLALVDLCSAVIHLCYGLANTRAALWQDMEAPRCLGLATAMVFPLWGAAAHSGLIALERFLAIMFPLRYNVLVTRRFIISMTGLTWMLTLLAIAAAFLIPPSDREHTCGPISSFPVTYILGMLVGPYFMVVLFLVLVYGKIFHEVRRQEARHRKLQLSLDGDDAGTKKLESKAARMLGLTMLVLLLAYLPWNICACLRARQLDMPLIAQELASLVGASNTCCNFVIYSYMNSSFRKVIRELMPCLTGCFRRDRRVANIDTSNLHQDIATVS